MSTHRLGENRCPKCGAPSLASVLCKLCSLPASDWFSAVYAVLIVHLDAPIGEMWHFTRAHGGPRPCDEFRFQGRLGFGGKYRRKTNTVDCYPEDETPGRLKLIKETNAALAALNAAGQAITRKETLDTQNDAN